ncbi:MAG: DUF1640 domain-containing protein [Magnetococcales bacterium]|nr:DUF1640 domain-containing protein [Magnetococcales bacterium]
MAVTTFDTLKFVETLKASGFDEPQAKGMAAAIQEVQNSNMDTLATKADLRELEYRIIIRLGSVMIAGFSALAVLMKLH